MDEKITIQWKHHFYHHFCCKIDINHSICSLKILKNMNVKNCVIFHTNLHCKAFVVANVCVCTRFIHPQCDTIDQDNYHCYSLKPSIVKKLNQWCCNLIKSKMDKGLWGYPKIVLPSLFQKLLTDSRQFWCKVVLGDCSNVEFWKILLQIEDSSPPLPSYLNQMFP